ncbi:hypothetical protein U0X36_29410 [Bacillus thuringiensis]|uniref:hypothetical protein n=1 Tax=Bacillus thuringiensis TaxID=1428 RepID=UPI000E533BC9|nr:hypothetical protein [Bacillus thuringiensis]MDZ3956904.1 hypothetical protein [Bacillus thuringiensis]RGP42335.1 hypothetical protein BTW32_31350 [Bacillus thuringiensis]
MGTCSRTEDVYIKDLSSYTVRAGFDNVSSYILDQIGGYKVSLNDRNPVISNSYMLGEQGEMKINFLYKAH